MNWQIIPPPKKQSCVYELPKPTKAAFRYILHGCDKAAKANLIKCYNCNLIVHTVCYGVEENIDRNTNWKCERCRTKSFDVVSELKNHYFLNH